MLLLERNKRHLLHEVTHVTYYRVTCASCTSVFAASPEEMYRDCGIDGRAGFQRWALGKEGCPPPPCLECREVNTLKVDGQRGPESRIPVPLVKIRMVGVAEAVVETNAAFLTRAWTEGEDYYISGDRPKGGGVVVRGT